MINNNKLNVPQENGEISFWEIADFLRDGWQWLVTGVVAGLIVALGFLLVSPAKYEAIAIVSPARVGSFDIGKSPEIEPLAQTIERLRLPTFYNETSVKICQATSSLALASSFNASQVKGNTLIRLSYRGPSPEVAQACIDAVLAQLIESQATLIKSFTNIMKEELAMTQKSLMKAESFQAQLERYMVTSTDCKPYLGGAVSSNYEQITRLQRLLIQQKLQLSASITKPMELLEQSYLLDRMVAAKQLVALAGGLFGGLFLGVSTLFIRRSWLANKVGKDLAN